MSDNLSCSHMIGIKALNTVKPFIFNGLAAMSHLLQRAGQEAGRGSEGTEELPGVSQLSDVEGD